LTPLSVGADIVAPSVDVKDILILVMFIYYANLIFLANIYLMIIAVMDVK